MTGRLGSTSTLPDLRNGPSIPNSAGSNAIRRSAAIVQRRASVPNRSKSQNAFQGSPSTARTQFAWRPHTTEFQRRPRNRSWTCGGVGPSKRNSTKCPLFGLESPSLAQGVQDLITTFSPKVNLKPEIDFRTWRIIKVSSNVNL